MSKTVQWKRGNTAQNSTYTGAQGEITVNTTNYTLVVHDGVTAGGYALPNYSNTNVAAYLTTSTGNISAGNITANSISVTSVVQFANLTTTQINAITPTTRGMTVFNFTTGNIQVYNGTKWANITLS